MITAIKLHDPSLSNTSKNNALVCSPALYSARAVCSNSLSIFVRNLLFQTVRFGDIEADCAILRQIEQFGSRLRNIGSDWAVYVQIGRYWAGLGDIGPDWVILYLGEIV